MSFYGWLGIPEAAAIALFIFSLSLMITPYFGGVKIGSIDIPNLPDQIKTPLKILGPVIFLMTAAAFYPGIEKNTGSIVGRWMLIDTIDYSSKDEYLGMVHRFEIEFKKEGALIVGIGEKKSSDKENLKGPGKSILKFSGTLSGTVLTGDFFEDGEIRNTTGKFHLRFSNDFRNFDGSFYSVAGDTRGQSRGYKLW